MKTTHVYPWKITVHHTGEQRGFTLIELLVVVAIIGLLSSIVLTSLNSARGKARDARRLADMRQMQTAFELYYDDNNAYPPNPNGPACGTCMEGGWNNGAVLAGYIPAISKDPLYTGANGYRYALGPSSQSYTMLVRLEKNTNWCNISTSPGYSAWNYSNGSTYPRC